MVDFQPDIILECERLQRLNYADLKDEVYVKIISNHRDAVSVYALAYDNLTRGDDWPGMDNVNREIFVDMLPYVLEEIEPKVSLFDESNLRWQETEASSSSSEFLTDSGEENDENLDWEQEMEEHLAHIAKRRGQ